MQYDIDLFGSTNVDSDYWTIRLTYSFDEIRTHICFVLEKWLNSEYRYFDTKCETVKTMLHACSVYIVTYYSLETTTTVR